MYKVNLIPYELQPKPFYRNSKMLRTVFIIVLVGIITSSYCVFLLNLHLQKEKLESLQMELISRTPSIDKLDSARNTKSTNHQKIIQLQKLLKNNVYWFDLLQDVNSSLSQNIWLSQIQFTKEKYDMKKKENEQGFNINEMAEYDSKKEDLESVPTNNYKRVLVITGVSKSLSAIGVFIYNLQQLPYFDEVNLEEARTKKFESSEMLFSINAVLLEGEDIE